MPLLSSCCSSGRPASSARSWWSATDMALAHALAPATPLRWQDILPPVLVLAAAYGLVPAVAPSYAIDAIILPFLALSLAGVGLNVVTGYCGQLSLGTAAFMA